MVKRISPRHLSQRTKFAVYSIFFSLVFAVCNLVFISSVSASGLVKAPNNLGLVGYWSFEDGTSTKATDFSGNGSVGTLVSSPAWASGKRGKALSFDGATNYVTTPQISFLNSASAFSFAAWINRSGTNHLRAIMGQFDNADGTNGSLMENGWTGVIGTESDIIVAVDGSNYGYTTSALINTGVWHHVVGVFDGSLSGNANRLKIYIDGAAQTLSFDGTTIPASAGSVTAPFRVGAVNDGGNASRFWTGAIDEARLYNRALTAAEITTLYNSGGVKVNASMNTRGPQNGLIGQWSFDGQDISGTTAYDRSGSGNNGTLNNTPLPIKGRIGQGLNFSGTNYVTLGSSLNQTSGSYSISTWLKPSSFSGCDNSGDGCVFINQNSGVTQGDFWFGFTSQGILTAVFVENGPTTVTRRVDTGGTIAVPGEWYHVVIARSSIGPTYALYINGVSQPLTTFVTGSGSGGTYIGTELAGNSTYSFRGIIDDMRLYNRALSATEVAQLYGAGTARQNVSQAGISNGLVLWHTFDGKYLNTTTSTDSSSQGNNGTLTNGPVPTRGKIGQAISFDGSTNFVAVTNTGSLNFYNQSNFSASLWIKPNILPDITRTLLGQGVYQTNGWFLAGDITHFGKIELTSNQSGQSQRMTGGTILTPGLWYHVVAVKNGSTGKIYINGVDDNATFPDGPLVDAAGSGRYLTIGAFDNGPTWPFPGLLDDLRIYSRALSAAEVLQLYNAGK